MDERKCNLEGTWYQPKYKLKGDFKMYIDKKKKRNNKYLILGEIQDNLGLATFQGTISRKYIKFIIIYDLSALNSSLPSSSSLSILALLYLDMFVASSVECHIEYWSGSDGMS